MTNFWPNGRKFAVCLTHDVDRVRKMLEEKIDVTAFLVYFIEGYPESHEECMERRDSIFKRFKGGF